MDPFAVTEKKKGRLFISMIHNAHSVNTQIQSYKLMSSYNIEKGPELKSLHSSFPKTLINTWHQKTTKVTNMYVLNLILIVGRIAYSLILKSIIPNIAHG